MSFKFDFMVCWSEDIRNNFQCKRYFKSILDADNYLKDKKVHRSFVDMNMVITPNWFIELKVKARLANEIK
jgi:hypothetical protein